MKILIDTNVLLDMALKRNSNHEKADELIQSCVENVNQGFITSHSICDFFYIIRKDCDFETKNNWIKFIVNTFTILTEDKNTFINALAAEHFEDLEDQLQMECAANAELDYVITENLKDFNYSEVPAISSSDFIKMF